MGILKKPNHHAEGSGEGPEGSGGDQPDFTTYAISGYPTRRLSLSLGVLSALPTLEQRPNDQEVIQGRRKQYE